MSNFQNSQTYSVDTQIERRGFVPELFTVAPGAYASNSAYGVGSPLVNSYGPSGSNSILPRGTSTISVLGVGAPFITSVTGCDIRQHDTNIEFNCSVSLTGAAPPFPGLGELRIRPTPPIITQPVRWSVPLPSGLYPSQYFDVEILNAANGQNIAPPANAVCRARLLVDGLLALYFLDTATQAETAVTSAWLAGNMAVGTVINVVVRGKYLAGVPSN